MRNAELDGLLTNNNVLTPQATDKKAPKQTAA